MRRSRYISDLTHIHYVAIFAPFKDQTLWVKDHEFHNCCYGLHEHYNYAFSFSTTYVEVEKWMFENWSIFGSFVFTCESLGVVES